MHLESFHGQSPLLPRLIGSLREGRIAHALLIHGTAGVGKRSLARLLAQTLYCTAPSPQRPCGACDACARFQSGNHPDALLLATEKNSLGVDLIREVVERLGEKPYEGGFITVRIERADKLTPQAQNALLKTLEEPPEHAVFFLTADSLEPILPTVRSRCQMLPLAPAAPERVERALLAAGADAGTARSLARLSGGSYGKALEGFTDEGIKKARADALDALLRLKSRTEVAEVSARIAGHRQASEAVLETWETALRDMLVLRLDAAVPLYHPDREEAFRARAEGFTAKGLRGMMEEVRLAKRRMHSNVLWQHASEAVLLRWMEGIDPW